MGAFWYRGPLPPESPLFRGRTNELNRLLQLCLQEVETYATVYGGRQTGKTSLLSRLTTMLPPQTHVSAVDFQFMSGVPTPEACAGMAREIVRNIGGLLATPDIRDAHSFSQFLCEIMRQSQAARHVLLVEELGALPASVREDIANLLRAIFNNRFTPAYRPLGRLMVIIAGSLELYELAAIQVSPLNNICEPIHLPDLSEPDAVGLIADGLTTAGLSPTQAKAVGQSVYSFASGHPYLTQRLGSLLEHELANGAPLTATHVDAAVAQLLQQDDPLLSHLRRSLDEEPKLLAASQSMLTEKRSFSRADMKMARLELLGLASPHNGYWHIRNHIFAQALHGWFPDTIGNVQVGTTNTTDTTNRCRSSVLAEQGSTESISRPQADTSTPDEAEATTRTLRVFLCHAAVDKPAVRNLYHRLCADGIDPWFDEESLEGGEHWQEAIARAVRSTDAALICLSTQATAQTSHFHKQISLALDVAEEHPEGSIFIIPLKLEACDLPHRLQHLYPVNLLAADGYQRLLRSLHKRADALERTITPPQPPVSQEDSVGHDRAGTHAKVQRTQRSGQEMGFTNSVQQGESEAGREGEKPQATHDTPIRQLTMPEINQLVDLLLKCDSMQDRDTRSTVLHQLPECIQSAITYNGKSKVYVQNIVTTCNKFPDGLEALINAVRRFDGKMSCMQDIDVFLNSLHPHPNPYPPDPDTPPQKPPVNYSDHINRALGALEKANTIFEDPYILPKDCKETIMQLQTAVQEILQLHNQVCAIDSIPLELRPVPNKLALIYNHVKEKVENLTGRIEGFRNKCTERDWGIGQEREQIQRAIQALLTQVQQDCKEITVVVSGSNI